MEGMPELHTENAVFGHLQKWVKIRDACSTVSAPPPPSVGQVLVLCQRTGPSPCLPGAPPAAIPFLGQEGTVCPGSKSRLSKG